MLRRGMGLNEPVKPQRAISLQFFSLFFLFFSAVGCFSMLSWVQNATQISGGKCYGELGVGELILITLFVDVLLTKKKANEQ